MLDQISSVFFEEANELLDNLEGYLLTLETEPQNQEIISAVFRAMHTIKGSSGMFGFDDIQNFTHEMESAFDKVRNGFVPVSPELINLTLKARDHIRSMLGVDVTDEIRAVGKSIIDELHGITGQAEANAQGGQNVLHEGSAVIERAPAGNTASANAQTWRIIFRPSKTIMQNGTRPELLIKELSEMGKTTVVTFTEKVPALSQINADECYLSWDVILTTDKSENDIQDVFIFLDSESKIDIEKIPEDGIHRKLGEILVSRNLITEDDINRILEEQKKLGEILVEKKVVTETQIKSALAEQKHIEDMHRPAEQSASSQPATAAAAAQQQSIRVNSVKLDQLIDLVGELVTFNARLSSIAGESKNQRLTAISELGEQLIFSLRDTAMDMRMLPIGTIFSRFRRLVHDLASQLGKNIELVTEGAETELDKTVIEKLNDPLVHLIRNSADHGIESPEERAAAGKDAKGIVTLSAKHAGAFVVITISDDGAGLNKEGIRNKAIERGLITADQQLTDQEIYEIIFQPGFSTNTTVTSVSGRGVGMDVVKRDIDSLGGNVSVETAAGKGTSFILKIPLTLAIIEGMLVKIGENHYVVPLTSVEECIEYTPEEKEKHSVCSHIIARGEYLPCINMREYFEIESEPPEEQQVIVVNDQTSKVGIVVDHIVGNHQTVIKPLGKLYKKIEGLSGASILGDGSVALILDIFKLSDFIRKLDAEEK